ncbi:MAG TPA: non-canonical purine NTP pyrophosphatase, RdgB/HAM1 family [Alphaproteobacteria bacterium]|nr:non-canonical purine NTP pyrophosphatase, RdgB/HAM1 family [Alphaproteobacteria bacterium]
MIKNLNKILVASGNKGKIREITELLEPFEIEIVSTLQYNLPEPEETGKTFEENALIKAKYYADKTGIASLADDSGLEVHALDNNPGIYSARYAKDELGKTDFYHAMQKLEIELNEKGINTRAGADIKQLTANFTCALALVVPNQNDIITEGKVFGRLQFPPKGEKGFGYDPIFIAEGYTKTFAEIDPKEKHAISHRQKAFDRLVKVMKE